MEDPRVYIMIEFSYERGDMCKLAYIGATILNFWLVWQADRCLRGPNMKKNSKCGTNVGKITHTTPLIREFYHNVDSSVRTFQFLSVENVL